MGEIDRYRLVPTFIFFEVNSAMKFDREATYGMRLNIMAGTAVRFEPGQERTVELVELAGDRIVYGFNQKVMGKLKFCSKLEKFKLLFH